MLHFLSLNTFFHHFLSLQKPARYLALLGIRNPITVKKKIWVSLVKYALKT